MEYQYDQQETYYRMLYQLKKLLKRENLCHNTYLYKKMYGNLTVPLYIITEQSTVASISRNYDIIIDALQHTGLVRVVEGKEVKIIEHATVKINLSNHAAIRQIEKVLEQKEIKYEISKRYDQIQYINLTIFEQNVLWLEALIKKIDQTIDFQKASLLQDIKFGVDRIRKLKFQHAKQKTTLGKIRYSLQTPPPIFIRKALESSDQDQQESTQIDQTKDKINGKINGNGHTHKNKKCKGPKKARIHENDFPELATAK